MCVAPSASDPALPPHSIRPLASLQERQYNTAWIKQLRAALDAAGFVGTRIVAADGGWEGIVGDMLADPELAAAIDIVGAHYPNSPPPADGVAGLNKSFWASEMCGRGRGLGPKVVSL